MHDRDGQPPQLLTGTIAAAGRVIRPAVGVVQHLVCRFLRCQAGTSAIEYALVAALISVAIIVALTGVSDEMRSSYYDLITNAFN